MPPRRKDGEKMDAMNPYTTLTDVTEADITQGMK